MVACKITVGDRTKWVDVPVSCDSLPQPEQKKSCIINKLDDRINRIRTDMRSTKDFNEAREYIRGQGGTWTSENGMRYEITEEGWLVQQVTDHEGGVAQTTITALDFEPRFVAQLHVDLQGVPPHRRRKLLSELEEEVRRMMAPEPKTVTPSQPRATVLPQPPAPPPSPRQPEIIIVRDKDWLSRRSLERWGTVEWDKHLRPTQATLDSRSAKGQDFDPDLIYEGDTFEVISP